MPFNNEGNKRGGGGGKQNMPRGKQPPSDWRSRPPKGWEEQQDPPDDVPDHDED